MFGVALAITGDPDTAEDVARYSFEQASRRAKAYDRQRGSVRAWLTRIARDLGVDVIHARPAAPVTPDDLAALLAAMSRQPDPLEVAHEGAAALVGGMPAPSTPLSYVADGKPRNHRAM